MKQEKKKTNWPGKERLKKREKKKSIQQQWKGDSGMSLYESGEVME